MSHKKIDESEINNYLKEVEDRELAPWEQDQEAEESDDWFEKAAADFLAKPEIDPTLEEILEATKVFTRKNFALRSGLLYRQQLQNTPDYETVVALEPDLLRLAGEANWLSHNVPASNASVPEREHYHLLEDEHREAIIKFAAETLRPKLERSKVVKVTRSTKKPKNILAKCPPSMFAQLGIKYKSLLEECIEPAPIEYALSNSVAGCNVRDWLASYTGREVPPGHILIQLLWSSKERKQWLYGLVEYAQGLVQLVAHAHSLDPMLKPRKFLCYFQKRSEATLYRGQEELEAMIANMRADKLLPDQAEEVDTMVWEEAPTPRYEEIPPIEQPEPELGAPVEKQTTGSLRERLAARRQTRNKEE